MRKPRVAFVVSILLTFTIGFLLGAAAIHRPIPRAPVELPPVRRPWSPEEVLGLVGSLGIRTFAGHLESIPGVVVETDRTFVIALPAHRNRFHYVLVPKKDIRDTEGITAEDLAYMTDLFQTARHLAEKNGMKGYRLSTNARGLQTVAYLHFHMVGWRPDKDPS